MSYDCRTNHWRMFHDIRATFARHSHDVRPSIYYHRPPHDVLTKVVRLSHDGFARNDIPRKINILASIETSDYRGTTQLEGTRGLAGARLLKGVTLLGVGLLNGSKY